LQLGKIDTRIVIYQLFNIAPASGVIIDYRFTEERQQILLGVSKLADITDDGLYKAFKHFGLI